MRELRIIRIFVPALLLLFSSWQGANGQGALRSALRGEVAEKTVSLSQHALAALVSASLLGGTAALTADAHKVSPDQRHEQRQHLYQSELLATLPTHSYSMSGSQSGPMRGWNERLGEEDEEDNALAWSEEVTKGSGVFYLALRSPDYEHIHHVVYVGDTATGEPMLAGIFLVGHEEDHITLYAHDGWVTQGFMQRDVKVIPDPLDLYAQVTVFTIKDLNLHGRYTPVIPELFPVTEVGKDLQMVQYGVHEDDPESLANLPIKQRSCKTLDANVWGELGIGRSTCNPIDGAHGSFGAPIFLLKNGTMVGFFSKTTPAGAQLAEGMTQALIDFVIEQQLNPTAVDSKDKLAVTWGALKRAQ